MKTTNGFVRPRALSACALLLISFFGVAHAQVWEGTLGKSPVVVTFDPAATEPSGEYFYRKHRHGIELSGTRAADGSVALEEWTMGPGDDRPAWRLTPVKGDTLAGEWTGNGKRLPIRLRRVEAATLPKSDDPALAELRAQDPYRFLQLHGMPLASGKQEVVGSYRLQWWRQPTSGIELFRVISGYPAAQLPAINLALARTHWREVQSFLDCTASSMSDYESTTTLRYIGRDALSVSLFTSYYCGGAHPDFGDGPLNLDPRTGRILRLEDVLWLGKGKPLHADDGDEQPWFDYRSEVFAPWVRDRFVALYPALMVGETDEDCGYGETGVWDFPTWYITDQGVYLGAIFARAARVCDNPDWSILPWSLVDKHHGAVRIKP
jgi:hypothetical protein